MTFARSSLLPKRSGRTLRVGIVVSTYHHDITDRLLQGSIAALAEHGVPTSHVTVVHVPGSFELPYAAARLIRAKKVDAVICLGLILKGETIHDEVIAYAVAHALQELNIRGAVPVLLGVLTTNTLAEARARSKPDMTNKGYEAAMAALHMALLSKHKI